jgi:SAM-dependent methyltransferase
VGWSCYPARMQARDFQIAGAERYRAGDLKGAIEALAEASRLAPAEPAYLINLAELARMAGDPAAARRWLQTAEAATERAPSAERFVYLAAGWLDAGDRASALRAAIGSLRLGDTLQGRQLFCEALRGSPPRQDDRALVARAVDEAWGRYDHLLSAATRRLLDSWPATLTELSADPLLGALLRSGPIGGEALERRLTAVRSELLFAPDDEALRPLRANLALQGFINEYAWTVTSREAAELEGLRRASPTADNLLRLAGYACLAERPVADHGSDELRAVLRQQIDEPAAEKRLAEAMPRLTAIHATSEAVQRQYEENPYPRWVKTPSQQPLPLERVLRSALPFAPLQPIPNADAPRILVAGCGTGQHAIHAAQRYQGADVMAVDLSLASLGYAKRKAQDLGVANIAFAQADMLEITGEYDVVDAAGSLQCLPDPTEGAKRLTRALRPGGLFRFGVYSAIARRPLTPARDLGASFPSTPEGIRAFRQALLTAPEGDPVRAGITFSSDFFSLSACRDLLLHVREHQHTIPELREMLDAAGLRFLGFILPPETLNAYRQAFPDDPAATRLDNWSDFEDRHPQTFAMMYQFWAQKA